MPRRRVSAVPPLPFDTVPARIAFDGILCVFAAGEVAIRVISSRNGGRYFTVAVQVRENQPVIDSGPYRLLRHPAYAELLCVCLGFGIALGNWLAVIVAVVPALAAVVVRIRVEERMLLARIGAPYEDFCSTRSRLLPHVW